MRCRFIFFILALLPLCVDALYNGNPSFPMLPEEGMFISKEKWFGIKTGYEFDRVYDRKLHREGRGIEHSRKKVRKSESLSNFGVITLTFNERVELFGDLGAMSCKILQSPRPDMQVNYHSDTHFAWGAGGRAILAYWGELQFGVNASYVASDLPLSSLEVNHHSYHKRHVEIDFREWQVGIGVSYRVRWFTPYITVDYSDFRARIEHLKVLEFLFPKKHVTFKETYPIGIATGFALSPDRAFNLNVEVRMINENAVSLSADLKF
jgi:hypothetical protein